MTLDKRNLYRMPWSMNDNPIAWLEVSDICNLHCEGCYRQHITGHKTLEEVKEEVLFFKRWRNPDNVSIAGGEPLIYPHILELVSFIAQQGIKPVILTNACALKPDLLHQLKAAGLAGFTLHIDSHQGRPGWEDKTEGQLNELRQYYADMIAAEKGLYVIFNQTVYPSTFQQIPDVLAWGNQNIDRVHGLVFITYRTATVDDTTAVDQNSQQVDLSKLSYSRDSFDEKFVTSPEVHDKLKEGCPEYEASSYLGGSISHSSFKWLIGTTIGVKGKPYGSLGKRAMEVVQAGHHWFNGTYLAYTSTSKIGGLVFLLWPWDKGVRQALGHRITDMFSHPKRFFKGVYVQSISIIQAPDILEDGRTDMCDSCPDITYYQGKLVNSCRMDEYRLYGGFINIVEHQGQSTVQPEQPVEQAEH